VGRDALTRAILESAARELANVGQAEFSLERVAKGAYCSIGSVYERWDDRVSLLTDVANDVVADNLANGLALAVDAEQAIRWVLSGGRSTVLLAGELLLAAHTAPPLVEPAIRLWSELESGLRRHVPDALAWYIATYAIGSALLGALRIEGPDDLDGRVGWLLDGCTGTLDNRSPARAQTPAEHVEVPVVPGPSRTDEVSTALVEAARSLLSQRGVEGTTTRDIAAGAGVTTGAMYRRYEGKANLLADVLVTQLEPDRYTWTWDLVQALASDSPLGGSAAVLAQKLRDTTQDLSAQRVLLQVGIAARKDPGLRTQVAERISVAHDARDDMVRQFAEVGVLRMDASPEVLAWGFQVIPVGLRATLPLGIPLDVDTASAAMQSLLRASAARGS